MSFAEANRECKKISDRYCAILQLWEMLTLHAEAARPKYQKKDLARQAQNFFPITILFTTTDLPLLQQLLQIVKTAIAITVTVYVNVTVTIPSTM